MFSSHETRQNSIAKSIKICQKNSKESGVNCEEKAKPQQQLFLPGFDIGAMPNHLNRSSLIAPIAHGQRKYHRQTIMVTRRDCVLEYTGEQLDEADGDLIMVLIFFAQPHPMGSPVPIVRASILRKLKQRNTVGQKYSMGKGDYDWLHRRMKALTEATLFLEAKKPDGSVRYAIGEEGEKEGEAKIVKKKKEPRKTTSFRIVSDFKYDYESETYIYTLDPRWVQMFGNKEYALLDWDKRMQIKRGQDMAKTLQRLVATSADRVQRYSLIILKAQMEYASPLRKFKESLSAAVRELERLQIITRATIEVSTKGNQQLVLWLPPTG